MTKDLLDYAVGEEICEEIDAEADDEVFGVVVKGRCATKGKQKGAGKRVRAHFPAFRRRDEKLSQQAV